MIQFQFMDVYEAINELQCERDSTASTDEIDAIDKLIGWLQELAAHRETIGAIKGAVDNADLSAIKTAVADSQDYYV